MLAALIMGGVVCTALSVAGSFITDLKIGYWLGTTPKKQEGWKFLGTLVSAATVGGVMMLLNETYGFASGSLAAPQANAMAAVIDPLMNGVGAPWVLYGIGAVIAIVLTYFNTLSATSSKEALETAAAAFDEITDVLGLLYNRKKDEVPAEVTALVEKRAAAKKAKDWATADAIRAELTAMGWAVKDTAQGPQLSKL